MAAAFRQLLWRRTLRSTAVHEYAHVRRLGIVSDTEHQAVELARAQVLSLLEDRAGPFADADRWAAWCWNPDWMPPRLPQRSPAR